MSTTVLSSRELQLLTLASFGFTNPQIGAHLYLTTDTVAYVLRRSYAKLGAKTRAHAVSLALLTGEIL